MSLNAQVRTDINGNITIHMKGGLDYENTSPLRKKLKNILNDNPRSKVTLDMFGLDFVGSSGISHFVETINILNKKQDRVKLSNVKQEFIRVFKLYNFDFINLIINEFESDETEFMNQKCLNRSNTFQN